MSAPLFSTYTTDENRVSGSMMATLSRLSLTTLQQLLSGAAEEDLPFIEFRTQPANQYGPGTPDGSIEASFLYLFEMKIVPDSVDVEQLLRHHRWIEGSTSSNRRLFVVTPDPESADLYEPVRGR